MMRRLQNALKMRRALAAFSLSAVTLFALGCGGTAIPGSAVDDIVDGGGVVGGVTGGGDPIASGEDALAEKDFSIIASVSGNAGSTMQTAPSTTKGSGTSRQPAFSRIGRKIAGTRGGASTKQGTGGAGSGSGSNGNDIVGLNGNNYGSSGLNQPLNASVVFLAEGSSNILGEVNIVDGNAMVDVGGKELGAGQNLVVEITANSRTSRAVLPSSFFANGGAFGFNAVLLSDGAMVVEIFPDSLQPLGQTDNGSRIIVDTAVDCFHDGNLSTVARLETPDGMVLYDSNLDGNFGAPEDACILFDTNGDGQVRADDLPVSYAIDPNLDGTTNEGEERLLGNNIPEDFINGLDVAFAPANPVGNGLSTVTLGVDIKAAPDGNPIGAALELNVEVISGTLNQAAGEDALPRWVENGRQSLQRTLDPNSSNISILSDGSLRLLEALRVPVLESDGELAITLRYVQSDRPEGVVSTQVVPVRKNEAPTLSDVSFVGTRPFGSAPGLEAKSNSARVVYGNPVQLIGANFATGGNVVPMVTFGGVPAEVTSVSLDGTTITTSVPEGAQSGKIAVLQNGIGAQTNQNFDVAGMPLRLTSALPSDGEIGVDVNSPIILRFNSPVSAEGIENGFLVETSAGIPVPGNTEVSEDGLTITHTPNGLLPAETDINVILSGALRSPSNIRYDDDVTDTIVPGANRKTTVATFTTSATSASDMVRPTVDLPNLLLNAPAEPEGPFTITIPFSEAISPGTLFSSPIPTSADSIRFRSDNSGDLLPLSVIDVSVGGEVFTLRVDGEVLGRAGYTLELSPTIEDVVGNLIDGTLQKSFATPLRIDRLSSVSGPIGTRVIIEGSTFDGAASVTFAGEGESTRIPATIIEEGPTAIEVEVPEDAVTGPIEVLAGGMPAFSPKPFTITSSGFEPRDIAQSVGAFGIALDVEGRGIVSYQGSGEIGFIDVPGEQELMANGALTRLPIGGVPTEAVLNRSGTLGFTTNFGDPSYVGESVFVIDMEARSVLSTIRVGRRPTRLAVSPDDRFLYVTNYLDDNVSVVDLSSLQVVAQITSGIGPNGITISPDNKRGYICNYLEETITVFDTTTRKVLATIVVGQSPARALISPDASRLFVTNNASDTITVINAQTLAIEQEISGFSGPSAMVFDPNGARFFVTNRNSNTIQEVVDNGAGAGWGLGETLIATDSKPAGCVISSDGSLLAFTTEGAGKVSVVTIGDPRMTITGVRIDSNDQPGTNTLTVDGGRKVWIEGKGFGTSHSGLTVRLGGTNLRTFATGFTSRRVQVLIPSNATSGPLIVSRTRDSSEIISNDIPLLVTGRSPQVISSTPGDGARGVDPDTSIVLEISEPLDRNTIFNQAGSIITGPSGLPVLRVVQLDDQGGVPTNVSGTWTIDQFSRKLEFTRNIDPLTGQRESFFKPESNNVYEVVVGPQIRDLFGNPVVGALTTFGNAIDSQLGSTVTAGNDALALGYRGRFITQDERGPRIRKALYRDLNGNGPSAGDEIELEFDEELLYNAGTAGAGGIELLGSVLFSNGLPGTTLTGRPGSSPQRVVVTLGTGAELNFGENATTVNAVSSTQPDSIAAFTDYSMQRPTAGAEVEVKIDPRYDNQSAPRMLFAFWNDADSSSGVTAGDELVLEFSEAVLVGASATPQTLLNISSGSLADATFVARQSGEDYRQVRLLLGAASSFTPSSSTLTLVDSGNGFVADGSIIDLGSNEAYAGLPSEAVILATMPGDSALDAGFKPLHIDIDGTASGLSEGDVIIIRFTEPVRLNTNAANATPSSRFRLGVEGDRFGSGARLEQPAFVTPRGQAPRLIERNEIVIRLGKQPVLTLSGEFGVDISGN